MARTPNAHEIQRYLDGKGANNPCEACGNGKWHIIEEPLKINGQSPFSGFMERVISVVGLGCTQCGNIRFFPLGTVEEWLKENQE